MTCELAHEIDICIETRQPFAVYRMPYEQEVHFVKSGLCEVVADLDELDRCAKEGFVISPFELNGDLPIVFISEEATEQDVFPICDPDRVSCDISFEEYKTVLSTFKECITDGLVDKLVLSRSTSIPRNDKSLGQIYAEAVRKYPRMMIYLCQTPHTGIWMGCSPEILVEGSRGSWRTVALAGTKPYAEDVEWDNKNRSEQHFVELFIEKRVSRLGTVIDKHGPYTSRAGHLAHLRTDYFFTTPDNVGIGTIAKHLHPTPAVCGLPQKEALDIIRRHEPIDRQYYSGFVGVVGKESRLFVNLRCVKVSTDKLTFFAGGGILSTSEPESEWWETEAKMATLRNLFDNE